MAGAEMDVVVESPRDETSVEPIEVLVDASALLLATRRPEGVLQEVLDLANRILAADAYAVWHTEDDGGLWRMLASRGLSAGFRTQVRGVGGPLTQWAIPDVFAEAALTEHTGAYRAEGIASLLSVPMALGSPKAGYITLYWRTPCAYEQMRVPYAAALANLAAGAITLSELSRQNEREKANLRFLAEASSVLASSLDYETTLQRVAKLAASHVADWCTVHVVEHGQVTGLTVAHRDPDQVALAEEYSRRYPEKIREDRGIGLVLKTGRSTVTPITDEVLVRAAENAEHLALLRKLGVNSLLVVALESHGTVVGVIRFANCHGTPPLTQADVPLIEDLAQRAAVAIENARLHRAVTEQENRLRLSHAAARMGSWSWDLLRGTIDWSPEFKALHGLPPDAEAHFEAGSSLVHPQDRDQVLGQLKEALASEREHISYEHRSVRPDGQTLWVHSRGRIERDAAGRAVGIAGISIDVTERHQAEEALRRTEKLAAAGRLAATVAHEVNNPLEALMNLVYLTRQVRGLPEEAEALLATADGELSRMAVIVRQTLGFYRESSHPILTHMGSLVAESLALYQAKAHGRGVVLVGPETGNHLRAYLNGGEIRQVITNLLSNAIDASPAGGHVWVTLGEREGCVEITVTDEGAGIAEEHRAMLFEPFFTTKADVGTGLGLWVSKGIVENHRGSIAVSSGRDAAPRGTTFTVRLPLELD